MEFTLLNYKQMREIADKLQCSLTAEGKSKNERGKDTEELFKKLVPDECHLRIDNMRSVNDDTSIADYKFNKWTLLHFAAHIKSALLCEFLISQGASVEARDECCKTPVS